MPDTKSKPVLIVITLILIAILGLLVLEATKPEPEDKIVDSITDVIDGVSDQIGE